MGNGVDSELWVNVPGYEGYYEVSNYGRIKGKDRRVKAPIGDGTLLLRSKPLKGYKENNGYIRVSLCKNGIRERFNVHQIVCAAFHGPKPSSKHSVAHNDGNSMNNHKDNSRWATQAENLADRIQHGTIMRGERNHQAKLTKEDVLLIRSLAAKGIHYKIIAKRFPVTDTYIQSVINRTWWSWLK